MSKKLLNEAQVRRFMGLAGIEPTVVSNKVNEWYKSAQNEGEYNKDEEVMQEEEEEEAEEPEMPPMDMDADAPEMDAAPAMDPQALAMELIDALAPVFEKHGVELAASEDGAPAEEPAPEMDMDMPMDAAAPEGGEDLEMADEEEPMEEGGMAYNKDEEEEKMEEDKELEEVNVQLNQEEIVNEVAKRVINRIRTAKVAKRKYEKALGKK